MLIACNSDSISYLVFVKRKNIGIFEVSRVHSLHVRLSSPSPISVDSTHLPVGLTIPLDVLAFDSFGQQMHVTDDVIFYRPHRLNLANFSKWVIERSFSKNIFHRKIKHTKFSKFYISFKTYLWYNIFTRSNSVLFKLIFSPNFRMFPHFRFDLTDIQSSNYNRSLSIHLKFPGETVLKVEFWFKKKTVRNSQISRCGFATIPRSMRSFAYPWRAGFSTMHTDAPTSSPMSPVSSLHLLVRIWNFIVLTYFR